MIITVLNADPESVVVLLIHQSVTKLFMRNYSENIFNNIAKMLKLCGRQIKTACSAF